MKLNVSYIQSSNHAVVGSQWFSSGVLALGGADLGPRGSLPWALCIVGC